MKILSLCGSIRTDSSNHNLLLAVEGLLPQDIEWVGFQIKQLPFFDPILQFKNVPDVVSSFRKAAFESDYIVISTPEYAHGIPGILKNALEWLVCEETMKKKVVVFIATSSGGEFVREYLLETLRTMDMLASMDAIFTVTRARASISASGEILDADLREKLKIFLNKTFQ
ncbi:MAG: NAD(P)H-dependent oxidoreductase [Bdellovibrionales bacterium]|nr:NAD(P)H-dependent oxidoreductase [Bdellovibrionales bacterium]